MNFFNENRGQFDEAIRFVAITDFGKVIFYDSRIVYALNRYEAGKIFAVDYVTLTFPGSNVVKPKGMGLESHQSNFFIGDSKDWVVGARNYRSIVYQGLWDGIDFIYEFRENGLKYEFIIAPLVPIDRLTIAVEGASLNRNTNSVTFDTGTSHLTDGQLTVKYENSDQSLPAVFIGQGDRFGFSVPQRDILKALVIDPLVYSTYMGGSGTYGDSGQSIAVDSSGNAYVTGSTTSTDFPLANAYQDTFGGGGSDAYVLKLNPNGSELIYSTFIGGNGGDGGGSTFVDSSGNVYVAGSTDSANFPLVNAYQGTYGGGDNDAFVLKLNPEGSALLYSTYFGGSGADGRIKMVVDSGGNAYVTGQTDSTDLPIANAYQATFGGGPQDAFAFKLNPTGSVLLYSTYIGGSDYDWGYSIAVDSGGNAFLTGCTASTNFPLVNAYQSAYAGNGDAFVLKLNPTGNALIFSTYIGGSDGEMGYSICVDSTGNAYLTGNTWSTDFPLCNPFQSTKGGGWTDAFVLKLNPAGNALIYSTYVGGNSFDDGNWIAVDSSGNAFVAGYTGSTDFPLANAYQSTYGGGDADAFVFKLNPTGNALLFSTYIGGSDDDNPHSIAVDSNGNFYVAGTTYSTNFPVHNAYQGNLVGWRDAFIFKFRVPAPPSIVLNVTATAGNRQVTLDWQAPLDNGGSPITGYQVYRGTSSNGETRLIMLGDVLTYNDTPLTNGQTYYYKVSAINSDGDEGPQSSEVWATPVTVPNAPQGFEATAGNTQITLTWSSPGDNGGSAIVNFKVYRGTTSGEETLLTTLGNVLTYTNIGLINGQAYYYKVSAVNSVGEGSQSDEVSATPVTVPTAPRGLQAVAGDSVVELNWTAPSYIGPGTIVYHLFRNGSLLWSGSGIIYTDTNVANGFSYTYNVAAGNSVGWGENSSVVLAAPIGPPSEPTGLMAIAGDQYVNLTWSAPAYWGPGGVTYHLFRDGVEIWSGTMPSHNDTSLVNGITYTYSVSASNSLGWGPNSTAVQATPQPDSVPTVPRGLTATAGNSLVDLNWTAPSYLGPGTITYHLFRDGTEVWSGTGLGHIDTGLTNFVAYSYTVAARNSIGWGLNCTAVQATPLPSEMKPTPPRDLVATPGYVNMTLTWNPPEYSNSSAVSGYMISYGTSPSSMTNQITWNQLVYVLDGLTKGQTYYFKVAAQNNAGWGLNSTTVAATPFGVPSEPMDLAADAGDSYIQLSWSAPSYLGPGTLSYHLFRNGTLLWSGALLAYNDSAVVNDVIYTYKVAAQNDPGWGTNSSSVSATPTSAQTPPGVPVGLQASVGDGQVTLTWNAPSQSGSSAITGYKVYRGASAGSLVLIATVTGTTHIDDGLTNGQIYHYKVSAVSSAGEGALTEEVVATPAAPGPSGGGDIILIVVIVTVIAIVGIGAALFYMRKKK